MRYGSVLPKGDARTAANFAREAEQAGWDGFFVWEPVWGVDAWVSLAAAAMVTERIRLGTMISPVARMRPWKLASETATLDNLSGGWTRRTRYGLGGVWRGNRPQNARGTVGRVSGYRHWLVEGATIQLRGQTLHGERVLVSSTSTTCSAAAHSYLGCRRLVAPEVNATCVAVRWSITCHHE